MCPHDPVQVADDQISNEPAPAAHSDVKPRLTYRGQPGQRQDGVVTSARYCAQGYLRGALIGLGISGGLKMLGALFSGRLFRVPVPTMVRNT